MNSEVDDLRPSRIVLEAEITALRELVSLTLDDEFEKACRKIFECAGKLVVTGMGKAGLIGQKISATLRSTGQPSCFLDPAQALHGDMGMIGSSDCILALSNSGKTSEVLSVCNYAKARGLPIIAITTRQESPLCDIATQRILYPEMPEGCPIGCAPMASTIMMLAIGDAVAAQLMVRRNFSAGDFVSLHHGGYLGQMLART